MAAPWDNFAALLVTEDFVLITATKKARPRNRLIERPKGRQGERSANRRRLRNGAL